MGECWMVSEGPARVLCVETVGQTLCFRRLHTIPPLHTHLASTTSGHYALAVALPLCLLIVAGLCHRTFPLLQADACAVLIHPHHITLDLAARMHPISPYSSPSHEVDVLSPSLCDLHLVEQYICASMPVCIEYPHVTHAPLICRCYRCRFHVDMKVHTMWEGVCKKSYT